jgi:hypothetical protein
MIACVAGWFTVRYMTFPSEVPAKQSAALGGRLARRLLLDQETLFVSKPMVFRDSGT